MTMDRRALLIGSAGLLVTGCVYAPYDNRYYLPSAPGGKLWRHWTVEGPENIVFQDAVLEMRVNVTARPEIGTLFDLHIRRLEPKTGVVAAEFADSHIGVRTERGENWEVALASQNGGPMRFDFALPQGLRHDTDWIAADGTKLSLIEAPDGSTNASSPQTAEYSIYCDSARYPGEAFDVTIPALVHDVTRLVLPPIHFQLQIVHHSYRSIE